MKPGIWIVCIANLFFASAAVAAEIDKARERAATLRAEIAHHDELYFKKAAPEISDQAYDRLKRELTALENAFPETRAGATGPKLIGDDRSERFPSFRHREPMLSLEKAYTEKQLRAFIARTSASSTPTANPRWVIEPKYDGIAVSAIYERGVLTHVVTRGDGREGDDVTANAMTIQTLPRELNRASETIPEFIELRGEVFVSFAEFARINRERERSAETPFANPRNLAAGTLKLNDPREVASRKLEIVFYAWGKIGPEEAIPATQQDFHRLVKAWGLPGVSSYLVAQNATDAWQAVHTVGNQRTRFPFPTDGVVLKIDSVPSRVRLGSTENAPRWALAYKFSSPQATTRVLEITLQVGRTGVLTPVAELEPIQLGGSKISRATLHNRAEIARHDLRVGDFIWVERAGEITPAIIGVDVSRRTSDSAPYLFPSLCPVCGTSIVELPPEVATRCPNTACPAQVTARIQHFISKDCLDVKGLGEKTIARLVARGTLTGVADLYRLRQEDLTAAGMPRKSADRVLEGIAATRSAELWRLIHGLGLPDTGAITAKKLARAFDRLDALAHATADQIRERAGLTDTHAQPIVAFFQELPVRILLEHLREAGVTTMTARD